MKEWAHDFAAQRRGTKPTRAEVTEAVKNEYLRRGYLLTPGLWLQIAYWVVWILLHL